MRRSPQGESRKGQGERENVKPLASLRFRLSTFPFCESLSRADARLPSRTDPSLSFSLRFSCIAALPVGTCPLMQNSQPSDLHRRKRGSDGARQQAVSIGHERSAASRQGVRRGLQDQEASGIPFPDTGIRAEGPRHPAREGHGHAKQGFFRFMEPGQYEGGGKDHLRTPVRPRSSLTALWKAYVSQTGRKARKGAAWS